MRLILTGRAQIADAVNPTVLPLDMAAEGYAVFDGGAATKCVIDPHLTLNAK